jgi:purine nucleosidase
MSDSQSFTPDLVQYGLSWILLVNKFIMTRIYRLFLVIILFGVNTAATAQPRKLIIDCDPGIDDAMALVLAMEYPGFEILGITTVFGNTTLEQGTNNALRIMELSGKNIPIYEGAEGPLEITPAPPPEFVHGKDGLGNMFLPHPKISKQDKSAAQFIADAAKAHPGQITILAVGRLTNLAEAIKLDANLVDNIRELVIMGGALHVPGNVTPVAEANVWGDPHAADIVFTAPWKVTMIGLDVTTKTKLEDNILLKIKNQNKRYGLFLYSITRFYLDFHKKAYNENGIYVHDPAAVMYLIEPGIFQVKEGPVRVVTEGIAIGQTIMPAYDYQLQLEPWREKPFVTAAVDVDIDRFIKLFHSIMIK